MQRSLEEARKEGIIKHIEDIKMNNENKKKVNDGIVFMFLTSLMTRLVSLQSAILPKMIVRILLVARFHVTTYIHC